MDTYPDVPILAYTEAMPLIKSGDVLFASGSSAMSQMIRAATGSVWSHVGALLRAEALDRVLCFESVESVGVRVVPLSFYLHGYSGGKGYPGRLFLARHAAVDWADTARLQTFSQGGIDLLGRAYDQKEIAGIALRIVAQKLGYLMAPRAPDGVMICSEFLGAWLGGIGIDAPYNSGGYLAPDDWANTPEVTFYCELTSAAV